MIRDTWFGNRILYGQLNGLGYGLEERDYNEVSKILETKSNGDSVAKSNTMFVYKSILDESYRAKAMISMKESNLLKWILLLVTFIVKAFFYPLHHYNQDSAEKIVYANAVGCFLCYVILAVLFKTHCDVERILKYPINYSSQSTMLSNMKKSQ